MILTLFRKQSAPAIRTAVFLAFAIVAGLATGLRTGQARPDAAKLSSDLAHVPADASAFLSVRVADLWNHPALKALKADLVKEDPGLLRQLSALCGVELDEIERITFVVRDVGPGMAFTSFLTTAKPYDRKKVLATLGPASREARRKERILYTDAKSLKGLYLIDDRSFVTGQLADVETVMDGKPAAHALSDGLKLAAGKHLVTAGATPSKINETIGDQLPMAVDPFRPLFQAKVATLTFDVDPKLLAELKMAFAGDDEAKEGGKALKAALVEAGTGLKPALTGTYGPEGSDVLTRLTSALKNATVDVRSTSLHARLSADAGVGELSSALLEGLTKVRTVTRRAESTNNLKQIALAMHNYHDTYGTFPAAANYDKDGKPLLSWRVHLLPFLEHGQLYKQFHLDEPWDSEHNKTLIARMPRVFKAGVEGAKEGETVYQGFHGKGAFFEEKKGIRITEIPDGTSNTCMVLEAGRAVTWTKPEDIPFDPAKALPKLGFRPDGFFAAYCDGSVRFIRRATKEKTMKAIITRNGGEVIENE
jgi:hypothetical protein